MISERNFDPCIVFSFSKKECEALAAQVRGHGSPHTQLPGGRPRRGAGNVRAHAACTSAACGRAVAARRLRCVLTPRLCLLCLLGCAAPMLCRWWAWT